MQKRKQNVHFGECPVCKETVPANSSNGMLAYHNTKQGEPCEVVRDGKRINRCAKRETLVSRPRGDNPPVVSGESHL